MTIKFSNSQDINKELREKLATNGISFEFKGNSLIFKKDGAELNVIDNFFECECFFKGNTLIIGAGKRFQKTNSALLINLNNLTKLDLGTNAEIQTKSEFMVISSNKNDPDNTIVGIIDNNGNYVSKKENEIKFLRGSVAQVGDTYYSASGNKGPQLMDGIMVNGVKIKSPIAAFPVESLETKNGLYEVRDTKTNKLHKVNCFGMPCEHTYQKAIEPHIELYKYFKLFAYANVATSCNIIKPLFQRNSYYEEMTVKLRDFARDGSLVPDSEAFMSVKEYYEAILNIIKIKIHNMKAKSIVGHENDKKHIKKIEDALSAEFKKAKAEIQKLRQEAVQSFGSKSVNDLVPPQFKIEAGCYSPEEIEI